MTYTNYTIIPIDLVVVIDRDIATAVPMTGIDPTTHAVHWYGAKGYGEIEHIADPVTGVVPVATRFTNPNRFSTQIGLAQSIIDAYKNPKVYYSTINNNQYKGNTYELGSGITIDTPNTPQPSNTTVLVPPTPETFQKLYWYGNEWVVSSFDPNLNLLSAQSTLTTAVETSAAEQGALQSRIYSPVQLVSSPNALSLPTADYTGVDLGSYQAYLDEQVTSLTSTIQAATLTTELYSFDYRVIGDPNP